MTEKEKLSNAVDEFAQKMKNRLFEKIDEGFSGWDDTEDVSLVNIAYRMTVKALSINNLGTKDIKNTDRKWFIDIANFAMMIDFHNETK